MHDCNLAYNICIICARTRGHNTLRTLTEAEAASELYGKEGSLSLSDVLYIHPKTPTQSPSLSVAGPVDV